LVSTAVAKSTCSQQALKIDYGERSFPLAVGLAMTGHAVLTMTEPKANQ
jgi:hypothetical protein